MFTSNLSQGKSILNARFNFRFTQRVPKWLFSAAREMVKLFGRFGQDPRQAMK